MSPDDGRDDERRRRSRPPGPAARAARPTTKPAIEADAADREVDAAGEHHQRLAAGKDRERHRRAERRRRSSRVTFARGFELDERDHEDRQQDEQREIGRSRNRRAASLRSSGRAWSHRGVGAALMPAPAAAATRLPNMTTPIRMTPWVTVARLELRFRNVMSVRIRARMITATIGPNDAAASAGQADAAEDHGRHARQRVAAGQRRADPGVGGDRQPGRSPRTGPPARRR